jgi:hypothetical protein
MKRWRSVTGWIAVVAGVALAPFAYRVYYQDKMSVPPTGSAGYSNRNWKARQSEFLLFASIGIALGGIVLLSTQTKPNA